MFDVLKSLLAHGRLRKEMREHQSLELGDALAHRKLLRCGPDMSGAQIGGCGRR